MAALLGRVVAAWLLFWLLGVLVPGVQVDWAYGLYAVAFVMAALGCTFGPTRTLRAFADPLQMTTLDVRRCEENLEVIVGGKRYALVALVFGILGGLTSLLQSWSGLWNDVFFTVLFAFQGWLIAFLLTDGLATAYRERRMASIEGREQETPGEARPSAFMSWFGGLSTRGKVACVASALLVFLVWSPFSSEEPQAEAMQSDVREIVSTLEPTTADTAPREPVPMQWPEVRRVYVVEFQGPSSDSPARPAVIVTRDGLPMNLEEIIEVVEDVPARAIPAGSKGTSSGGSKQEAGATSDGERLRHWLDLPAVDVKRVEHDR